ncbi:MAG: hypothetical protein PVG14_20720 [Anaerolineales bacterium]|jgi:transcriptional regulator with XRE-family HTH domain
MRTELIRDALDQRKLSVRAAAREVGVSHTTLLRALDGENMDMPTIEKIAEWMGIRPSLLIDLAVHASREDDDLVRSVAAFIRQDPEIAEVFQRAVNRVENGKMSPSMVRKLVRYAAFLMEDRE